MSSARVFAVIDYEDPYVDPLLLSTIRKKVPSNLLTLISNVSDATSPSSRLLQWRQYEAIDIDHLMSNPHTSLANSYIIRKALIRKHFLSATVSHWLTKNLTAQLRQHVKPSIEFEVDYAEFLDDALVEAYELRESWARNDALPEHSNAREWWILKPGMSDRGQGIRLFSSEAELQAIFEEWDPPSDDEDEVADEDDDEEDGDDGDDRTTSPDVSHPHPSASPPITPSATPSTAVMTSHLRHFVAQPYIASPLLLPAPHPSAARKFHIRTYVLAVGALKVYVYRPMLALFAAQPYTPPSASSSSPPNDALSSHLTNTCLQSGEREGSVHAFWDLPDTLPMPASASADADWREAVFQKIRVVTAELFEAAARTMAVHFQPLPNAFELFGLDFLVDAAGCPWLLEVNAFPDFAQTGEQLQGLVRGLFDAVVDVAVLPFYGLEAASGAGAGDEGALVQVLDIDLGRR